MRKLIARWPGKSAVDDGGVRHPAIYHMLDVGAVAERLIAPVRLEKPLEQALILLAALHDLGKIGAPFRAMIETGAPQSAGRHWEMTEVLLFHHDALLATRIGSTQKRRLPLYAAAAGHHGRPPALPHLADKRLLAALGTEALRDSAEAMMAFADLWPGASLAAVSREHATELSWWLPGLVAAADWIGSDTTWFPPCPPGPSPADYLALARERAVTAVRSAGLDRPVPASGRLFDFVPRPMQKAAAEIGLPGGPVLAVIEDETGAGKTEAAMILAQRMMAAGKGRGLYFALPTTATADAMFVRARSVVGRLFETPPSLALAHGRAAQSAAFRDLVAEGGGATDEPACTEWLADNRRRALLATVGVGTIDQALLSVLPTKHSALRHFGLSSKILIVDEVHELGEPYIAAEMAQLLRAQRMAGGSAILLTATLPLDQRARLMAAWGAADDGARAYPALTVSGGPAKRDFPQETGARGPVGVRRLASPEDAVTLIAESARKGAACLWVRNAVDDAIAAVTALRAAGIAADLLHARFTLHDRLRHERAALALFGKEPGNRAGRVLVATQVVESSLDLDFDVMVSDLAPVAALVQRAGRLWRHMALRPASSRPVADPVLNVVAPDPGAVEDSRWLSRVLDRGAFVYPVDLQWRTARVLFDAGRIDAPSGLRALIESVHGADGGALPAALAAAEGERLGKGYAAANQARHNLVVLEDGYRKGGAGAEDTDYPTRLGRPQRRLMLAVRDGDALRPYAGAGNDGCQLSEVSAAESRLRGLDLPDQNTAPILALTKGWPDWRRRALTVCPLGGEGRICGGLRYDPELGLLFDGGA